jgi:hypothetical protein
MVRKSARQEAEGIASIMGVSLGELKQGKTTDGRTEALLEALHATQTDEEYEEELENEEPGEFEANVDMIWIRRLVKGGYIPKRYIEDARRVLYPDKKNEDYKGEEDEEDSQ